MRAFLAALFLLLCIVKEVLAQSTLASAVAELPSCALPCLQSAIEASTCSATNQTCICTNASLQAQVTLCVKKSCTVEEGLSTKNITETTCGAPIRDKSEFFNIVSNTFACISGLFMVLRVSSKLVTGTTFGFDDYFIFATFISGIPSSIISVHGLTSNGLGKDIWAISSKSITDYLRAFYVIEVLYMLHVSLLKLSILFFYLRIFPSPPFRRFLWATVVFDILFGVSFVIAAIFQCNPISYYWTQWDGLHEGKCLSINGLGWANAIISIILDVWMLGLALSQVIHLQLHWKKKVGVAMMFVVGTFVTVVSILRLQSLVQFANSTNITWDNLPVTIWSTVEINVGIICACMPSLRVLLVRTFPKFLGTSRNASTGDYYTHGSRGRMGTNASVGRAKNVTPAPPDSKTIVYTQSYDVNLDDETYLVPMAGLSTDFGDSKSQSSLER